MSRYTAMDTSEDREEHEIEKICGQIVADGTTHYQSVQRICDDDAFVFHSINVLALTVFSGKASRLLKELGRSTSIMHSTSHIAFCVQRAENVQVHPSAFCLTTLFVRIAINLFVRMRTKWMQMSVGQIRSPSTKWTKCAAITSTMEQLITSNFDLFLCFATT
jgi:hypothetical protein